MAGALGFPTIIPATALGKGGKKAPGERVRIGLIGCGNRAGAANAYARREDAEIVALADPFGRRIETWKERWKKATGLENDFIEVADFREMLDKVDAVHIATGDHWHVPATLLAARADKHVYVEKPLGLSIEQCLACREIVEERKIQVQYGTQNRSTPYVRGGLELLLNGHLGEIRNIYVWCPVGESGGTCRPEPVPDDLDYQLWLGPAPEAPYCHDRVMPLRQRTGIFHIYDYAIGFLAGWGAHPMDQLQWWLDETGRDVPEAVEATGTLPTEGLYDTLTHWDAQLRYPDGLEVRFSDRESIEQHLPKLEDYRIPGHATLFVGTEGWVSMDRGSIQASSRELLRKIREPGPRRVVTSTNGHQNNFIDAIVGKNPVVSPLASAIRSDATCHLVDLAVRHGGPLEWDSTKATIPNNEAARAAMHRPMRRPWDVLDPRYT